MDKTKKPERVFGTKEPTTTSAKARILDDDEIERMRADVEAAEAREAAK